MIFDKLENLENYRGVHPRFDRALPFLLELIANNADTGRHEILDADLAGEVWGNMLAFEAQPVGEGTLMEAHRRFIDVQIVLEGAEQMFVPTDLAPTVKTPYNEASDVEFYRLPPMESLTRLYVPAGYFAIFFAGELHAPSNSVTDEPTPMRKLVGKVMQ